MEVRPLNGLHSTFRFDEKTEMCYHKDGSRPPFPRERLDEEVRILLKLAFEDLATAIARHGVN